MSPRAVASRRPDSLGVATLPTASVGRLPEAGQPPGDSWTSASTVHDRVERDRRHGCEVSQCQPGQRPEPAGACGLLDVEFHAGAIWSRIVSRDSPGCPILVANRARTHQMAASMSQRHQARKGGGRPATHRREEQALAKSRGQQHVPRWRARDVGGIRHARPAMSGSAPGKPIPFETRPMTSQDRIGSPSPGGAVR